MDRVTELGDVSVPFPFDVHAMIYCEDAPALERSLHRQFCDMQINKVNPRKEFFRIALGEIRQMIEGDGLEAHWTMKAEAAEYRESLAAAKVAAQAAGQPSHEARDTGTAPEAATPVATTTAG
jgi:hypothetical protein